MRSQQVAESQLFVVDGPELPVSRQALLELARAVWARGMPFRFRARGSSMLPFIQDGDVITVSPLRRPLPGVGEVVAFVRPGNETLVVHRVVARRGAAPLIQGDSLPQSTDGIIPPENLLGRVTRVERDGRDVWLGLGPERYAIAWLSRTGRLAPLCLRLASWLRRLRRR